MLMTIQIFKILRANPKGLNVTKIREEVEKQEQKRISHKDIFKAIATLSYYGFIQQGNCCRYKII
jgi:hypothetical protein